MMQNTVSGRSGWKMGLIAGVTMNPRFSMFRSYIASLITLLVIFVSDGLANGFPTDIILDAERWATLRETKLNGTVLTWALQWGWPGAWPVSGDYDGDGISDCAVFDQNTGYWYVAALSSRFKVRG